MARFERSKGRSKDSRDRSSNNSPRNKRDSRGRRSENNSNSKRSFEEYFKERKNSGSKRSSRNRRDFETTKVTCSSCGVECEVPFRPKSDKPLFCDDCFKKEGRSSSRPSSKDLDVINEKLDKIMKALDIE